jgi:hypothetical protein
LVVSKWDSQKFSPFLYFRQAAALQMLLLAATFVEIASTHTATTLMRRARTRLRVMETEDKLDPSDYAVIVKNRGPASKPWKWEITAPMKNHPVQQSSESFETMSAALRAGKKALTDFLRKTAA